MEEISSGDDEDGASRPAVSNYLLWGLIFFDLPFLSQTLCKEQATCMVE